MINNKPLSPLTVKMVIHCLSVTGTAHKLKKILVNSNIFLSYKWHWKSMARELKLKNKEIKTEKHLYELPVTYCMLSEPVSQQPVITIHLFIFKQL